MTEITYYLGAGASSLSMPLVSNFSSRFETFIRFLRLKSDRTFIDFSIEAKAFNDEVKNHLSFDTYFKKLFHQGNKDKIIKHKKILLTYFIFEHLINQSDYLNISAGTNETKKHTIDPRYDALIAGLLRPIENTFELQAKINFITWNYDLNLINSIRNFSKESSLDIHSFSQRFCFSENEFMFNSQLSAFHLNGYITHPTLSNLRQLDSNDLYVNFKSLLLSYFNDAPELSLFSSKINFAWDTLNLNLSQQPAIFKSASDKIEKSKYLIIIGYSFPLYNRIFDRKLLSSQNLMNTKIIIQNPEAEKQIEEFVEIFDLKSIIRNNLHRPTITPITNCNSFYVPNDILV